MIVGITFVSLTDLFYSYSYSYSCVLSLGSRWQIMSENIEKKHVVHPDAEFKILKAFSIQSPCCWIHPDAVAVTKRKHLKEIKDIEIQYRPTISPVVRSPLIYRRNSPPHRRPLHNTCLDMPVWYCTCCVMYNTLQANLVEVDKDLVYFLDF
jgi:hypothetical protein